MTQPEPTIDDVHCARAERERRRRARLRDFPAYGPWLESRSPEYCWHWRWQRYTQGLYDQVTAGRIKRLMIFAPPQHGKTEGGTVRYPVYRLERDPSLRIIVAANTQRLANTISRKARRVARAAGLDFARDRNAVDDWGTNQGGGIRAVGIGGAIAGNPAELAFIDDPVRNRQTANSETFRDAQWEWYCDDFYTRVHQSGAIILQTTRWHEDDLAGRILASEDGPNWTVVRLPALAEEDDPLGRAKGEALCPERFDRDYLERRRAFNPHTFEALYQGHPTPKEGGFFRRAWFGYHEGEIPSNAQRLRWWDHAACEGEGDYTAGVRMVRLKSGLFVIEDVTRGQWGPDRRNKIIRETAETDLKGTKFWREQEPGSSGVDAAQGFVRLLAGFTAKYETSTGSKVDRADDYASQLAIGNVKLCRGDWNRAFIEEHCQFPYGVNDDQVDAASAAFNKLCEGRKWQVS